MSDAPASTSPAPVVVVKRPHRWRRRLLRLLVGVVIGLILVVIGVQLFLWSDYPRRIGISVAQKITGLRIEMGSLTIGWFGDTSISDLAVSLPLEDKPFLRVPRVDVKHTSLVGIVLTQDVVIKKADVSQPRVDVRQDKTGAWNLQQALDQISGPAQNVATVQPETRGSGSIHLPDVKLDDAVVTVTTREGRSVELRDVALTASNEGPLAWRFSGGMGQLATVSGSVTPVGRWPHDVAFNVSRELAGHLRPLVGEVVDGKTIRLAGTWAGERTAGGVAGRLTIADDGAEVGSLRAEGAAAVTVDGGDVQIEPAGLALDVAGVPTIELAGGRVRYSGAKLNVEELRVRFADGTIRLTAAGDLGDESGSVDASWERVAFPAAAQHQGRFTGNVRNIWPGKPELKATLESRGTMAGRSFDAQINVTGGGQRWTDADYHVAFPRLQIANDRGLSAALAGMSLTLHQSAEAIALTRVDVPRRNERSPTVEARGAFNFAGPQAQAWWLWSSLQAPRDVRLHLNAFGDKDGVTLASAYGAVGADVRTNLTGQYRYRTPDPVALQLDLEADPSTAVGEARDLLPMSGKLGASVNVKGTLEPAINLKLAGHARSRAFKFRQFDIGDTALDLEGLMLPDYVNVQTRRLDLLGGGGWVAVKYPYFTDDLLAQVRFDKLSVTEIGQAAGVAGLSGTAEADLAFNIPLESPRSIRGGGEILVEQFVAPMVETQRVKIPLRVQNEWVQLSPEATQQKGGQAKAQITATFAEPLKPDLKLALQDWMTVLPLRDLYTRTSGEITARADVARRGANAKVNLENVFGAHESEIGNASLAATVEGRRVSLDRLTGQALEGVIFGQGSVDLDNIEQARVSLGIDELSLDRLAQLAPKIGDVRGKLSARLHAEPARGPRPLGAIEATFDVTSENATYKGIEVGNTRVHAFADRDRFVLADDPQKPNQIALAGGRVLLWGRVSGVPIATAVDPLNPNAPAKPQQRPSVFLQLRPEDLDIEQLNRIVDPDGKVVPGRLSGEITAFGNPSDYKALNANGRISITKSDLVNVGLIAAIYSAARVGVGTGEPNGYGDFAFRLQGERLTVPEFNYFNRGLYATLSVTIDDVFAINDAKILKPSYAIGAVRPLKDIELPFLADIDQIGEALQSGATTISLEGTLGNVKWAPASVKELGNDFRNILIGKTKRAQ